MLQFNGMRCDMRKIKVDDYDLKVIINGMYQMRTKYSAEKRNQVDDVLLSLVTIYEQMKHGKKKRIPFETNAIKTICLCLIDWRNEKIASGEDVAVKVINDMLILFSA